MTVVHFDRNTYQSPICASEIVPLVFAITLDMKSLSLEVIAAVETRLGFRLEKVFLFA